MGLINDFENYLIKKDKSDKTVSNYIGAFSFINRIANEINIPNIDKWNSSDTEKFIKKIKENDSFVIQNTKGNNMYSASLNNFKKFMQETNKYPIPPIKPFDNFKWRWAVTTPSEGINTPEVLIGVLEILNRHNGRKHATQSFQDELEALQNRIGTRIDLAKVDRGLNKNIIENSGQYWKALGLLNNSTGGIINLSDIGISLANGTSNLDDFISYTYSNFKLPNEHIESDQTIQEWQNNNIEIYPIKLIFKVLFELREMYNSPTFWYITPEELKDVIIPLSIYSDLQIDKYVIELLNYRKDKSSYNQWPNCAPGDNDFRMIKEYLLFLTNFKYLDCIELKDKTKRYYLNSKSFKLLEQKNDISLLKENIEQVKFDIKQFKNDTTNAQLKYNTSLIARYISSLATKPFVLLSGLSGSGKTKLAQSFAQWICEDEKQYCIVPVGADWTNREPLLGYVNALETDKYILPENGALQLIIEANKEANKNKPYFLILDEMNLSHVERYFADFLSVMESKDKFKLHSDKEQEKTGVPFELSWPKNLFVVGTVNIDETTYMFSPKVLDRANAIEFRVTEKEISNFLKSPNQIDLTQLESKGANMAADFIKTARNNEFEEINTDDLNNTLVNFFGQLQKTGAEFGYRTGMEIHRLYQQLTVINEVISENEKIDIAVMQKLLPKLHGSRRKLCPILETLGNICVKDIDVKTDIFENEDFKLYKEVDGKLVLTEGVLYPLSLEKITRMYKGAIDNGFASYAEA
ncbi:hypothetical protein Q4553_13125 [Tenacibaculum soleae]|uniref:McrB family protein n=1 Tax=Tenacibaculum soleae TaxID=447689 RepID=UPI0026E318EB|nr:hypothetical protein [Tenacibaculum soleae]MDO6745510.1 hypothetical protein [Tenacibaculum soleae]